MFTCSRILDALYKPEGQLTGPLAWWPEQPDFPISEFVAIILLGRVRLGSNRSIENARELTSAVCDVPAAQPNHWVNTGRPPVCTMTAVGSGSAVSDVSLLMTRSPLPTKRSVSPMYDV